MEFSAHNNKMCRGLGYPCDSFAIKQYIFVKAVIDAALVVMIQLHAAELSEPLVAVRSFQIAPVVMLHSNNSCSVMVTGSVCPPVPAPPESSPTSLVCRPNVGTEATGSTTHPLGDGG